MGRYELAWALAAAEAERAAADWAVLAGDGLTALVAEAVEMRSAGDPIELGRLHARLAREYRPLEDSGAGAEHRELRARFREFADREVRPVAAAIHETGGPIPDRLIEGAAALGLFDLSALDRRAMLVATEELAAASLNAAGSLITRPEILVRALRRAGTEAQRERWLAPITRGRSMVAVAVTEPETGSDVGALHECAATREPGGWRLDGRKRWTGFAARAELLAVLARTGPGRHRGLSLFVAEKPRLEGGDFEYRQPGGGSLLGTSIPIPGYRGMSTYDLVFDGFRLPEDALVGAPGEGFYLQMEGFEAGRLQTAGRAVGVMQAALEAALAYTAGRLVFGTPIAGQQLAQAMLGRMIADVSAARQLSYRAAALADAGYGRLEASLAKLYAARLAERVTRDAMQLHGGNGYVATSAVYRYFVDARVLTIFEGAEEVLALKVIARALEDRPGPGRAGGAAMEDVLTGARTVLETTPGRWLALTAALPKELLQRPPAPGEWSAAECLAHLAQTEAEVFPTRLATMLEGRTELAAFDPDVQPRPVAKPEPAALAAEFERSRAAALALLARVTAADLDRTATHSELGRVTLGQLIHEWAGHDLMHTVQAERALMQPFVAGSGPWRHFFQDHDAEARPPA